jgi:hypothetical protein
MLACRRLSQSRQQAAGVEQRQAVESGDQSPHSKRAMRQKLFCFHFPFPPPEIFSLMIPPRPLDMWTKNAGGPMRENKSMPESLAPQKKGRYNRKAISNRRGFHGWEPRHETDKTIDRHHRA